jgi:hypothetical protein
MREHGVWNKKWFKLIVSSEQKYNNACHPSPNNKKTYTQSTTTPRLLRSFPLYISDLDT